MIYIVSSKNTDTLSRALGPGDTAAWVEIFPRALPKSAGSKALPEDRVYLDISELSRAELKKALGQIKKRYSFWGIIDPLGEADDPATFFFEGASDYIGPALVKKGLDRKRFEAAAGKRGRGGEEKNAVPREAETAEKKKSPKPPAGKFAGWKSMRPGVTAPFFFLFATVSWKSELPTMPAETPFTLSKNSLRETLRQNLRDADALLWIEAEDCYLFLVPPGAPNARAAVEAVLRMIMNSRLIGIEKMGLPAPVEFTFALHYGKTVFRAPGETGAVISEPVNYVFHLGTRKAEAGRITLSDSVSRKAIPEGLADLFNPAGVFEGIPIRHSRRFRYK